MLGKMINTFRLKNFKAIRDSGVVKFSPLTVFIGNNGSGKSSLLEGLLTYQEILGINLDTAMNRWRGFEYVHNPPLRGSSRDDKIRPIEFAITGPALNGGTYRVLLEIGANQSGDKIFIQAEELRLRNKKLVQRDANGDCDFDLFQETRISLSPEFSVLTPQLVAGRFGGSQLRFEGESRERYYEIMTLARSILNWQFVMLNPYSMGAPKPQKRTGGKIPLLEDGSNIAEYLHEIRTMDQDVFDGIIETLQYVLPDLKDLQPTLTSELERLIYLRFSEGNHKIPGWLLSTGTLRVLALLALLRHPEPPPLIVIEEIENGLDPRTLNLIVEEMRSATEEGRTQIVATTHSPYFLDLLDLSDIVLVERIDGQPVFSRPADQESLREWAKDFGPGRLYTMSKLTSRFNGKARS